MSGIMSGPGLNGRYSPGGSLVNRRGVTSILSAAGMTTRSIMWPTHSSIMNMTGTRYCSERLKASMVRSKHSWGELGEMAMIS